MRLQDTASYGDVFSKTFMNNNVRITVWKNPSPTFTNQEPYSWRIEYHSRNGSDYVWNIPGPALYTILVDLARDMSIDVAEVIYEALWEWFNETLYLYQMDDWYITANMVALTNCYQIMFPPREHFREELHLIELEREWRLHPTMTTTVANRVSFDDMQRAFEEFHNEREQHLIYAHTPTITAWATRQNDAIADCVNYLTSEEYERKKANGELNPNTVYLVLNQ